MIRRLSKALLLAMGLAGSLAWAGMRYSAVAVEPKRVQVLAKHPDQLEAVLNDAPAASSVDLDKAWHGIHYLLTGTAWGNQGVLAKAILGGKEIGGDQGYGPARVLTPEEVRQVAQALAVETPEKLATRFNPAAMDRADIYPTIWVRDGREGLEYLLEYYKALRTFFAKAAQRNQAVIMVIN